MTKYGTSPWIDRFPKSRVPSYPRQRGPLETDVAIVGGGLSGCATAYAMAAADVKVVLIESERIGRGATGSGTGWIADDPGVSFADLQKALGLRPARRAWQAWHRAGLDFAALLRRLKISLEPHGSVDVATTAEQSFASRGNRKRDVKPVSTRRCSTPAWSARKPASPPPASARATAPRSIRIAPLSVWRRAASERGARVFERSPATRIKFGRRTADIQTRQRDDPRQPRRRGDRLADAALQGAAASLLVSPPLRGADGAGAGRIRRLLGRREAVVRDLGGAAAHRAVGG